MNNRHRRSYGQKGQAMVFSLLFLAVAIMTMLILYNQGQLVKNRVQLENAADAAVYSQAKLAARNLNFAAYTNRAMVANEVSLGEMVALLSWAKHYKQMPAFTSYPLYLSTIGPTPVTYKQVLDVVTIPYQAMGIGASAVAEPVVKAFPPIISVFNSVLGISQKVFALATLEAQIEVSLNVVKDHEFSADKPEMYIPAVGWFFFVQNTLLTYFGENFSPENLVKAAGDKLNKDGNPDATLATALVADFVGSELGTIDNMINNNTTGIESKKANNTSSGQNANMNSGEADDGDGAVEAYKRFAAIVNRNRGDFVQDRHWDFGPKTEFAIDLALGPVRIKLGVAFFAGIVNDGGTAYVSKGALEKDTDLESLGWSSIDVTSFGFKLDVSFFISVEFFGTTFVLLDTTLPFAIGFPVAGATHQLVSDNKHAKKVLKDWGTAGISSGIYGGDDKDVFNKGAFDLIHLATLGWGQTSPLLSPGGMYGTRLTPPVADVSTNYVAPPSFFSLGNSFQTTGVSREFTIALAKSLDQIETTDSDTIGITTGDTADWDGDIVTKDVDGSVLSTVENQIPYTRFDVETHSRVEGEDFSKDYQEIIWNDERPMMTVSSAETYFANPMQKNADGSDEAASLFSPFWDARLREPSAIAMLIATGEVKWSEIFEGLDDNATADDIVKWVIQGIATRVVDTAVDNVVGNIPAPLDSQIEPPLRGFLQDATKIAIDEIPVLDPYAQ